LKLKLSGNNKFMDLDLNKIKNVHFIGIGGIGISAVARMMHLEGKNVTGQDMQDGEVIHELTSLGIPVTIGQFYENIPEDTELVVYTIAIDNYDPELSKKIKSQERMIVKSYPEMLGVISSSKYTIAISGTHGKTTTTGMLAQVLMDSGNDPTVIIGSLIKDNSNGVCGRSNFIAGKSEYFVVEACEYRRSFLNINPKILIITNIDRDHLDYYKDIEDIKNAFREMAMKVPSDGYVICNPHDENVLDVIEGIKAKVLDYSEFFDNNLKLKIPGVHNKKNAAAAYAAARTLGLSSQDIISGLANFPGTWRRFEFKGKLSSGALVYDDYAHHPAEIVATLSGFRELYSTEMGYCITVIFQPHLFSRTKMLLKEFKQSFKDADEVLILPIYYAREEDDGTISSEILANEINKYTNNAKAFSDFDQASRYLESKLPDMNDKNIIVTMGAGEAFKLGDKLLLK